MVSNTITTTEVDDLEEEEVPGVWQVVVIEEAVVVQEARDILMKNPT